MTAASLTVGELRRTLSNVPDELPVIALYDEGCAEGRVIAVAFYDEGCVEGRAVAVLRAKNELPMVALVVA